ncbi:hypothetical protein HYV87_01195 [Candidatus Woesearchaeota archaeon]|nr:hypothetical protein [Candidatus Woesearchaeota archaeon]
MTKKKHKHIDAGLVNDLSIVDDIGIEGCLGLGTDSEVSDFLGIDSTKGALQRIFAYVGYIAPTGRKPKPQEAIPVGRSHLYLVPEREEEIDLEQEDQDWDFQDEVYDRIRSEIRGCSHCFATYRSLTEAKAYRAFTVSNEFLRNPKLDPDYSPTARRFIESMTKRADMESKLRTFDYLGLLEYVEEK